MCYFIDAFPFSVSWPLPESREQNRANLEIHMPPQEQEQSQAEYEKTTITIYQKVADVPAIPGVKHSGQVLTEGQPLLPKDYLKKSFCVAKKSLNDGAEPAFKDLWECTHDLSPCAHFYNLHSML